MTAFDSINQERERQVVEGFDANHDDQHQDGSIAMAACCILCNATLDAHGKNGPPWIEELNNRVAEKYKYDYRQRLVIAAAMIIAEIERFDRLAENI